MTPVRARELMTGTVEWIEPRAKVAEASRRLAAAPAECLCLLVGTPDAPPAGILTATDILRAALRSAVCPGRLARAPATERLLGPKDLAGSELFPALAQAAAETPVEAVMQSPVRSIPEDASAAQVMDSFVKANVDVLPVERAGRIVGLVQLRSVLRALEGAIASQAPDKRPRTSGGGAQRGPEQRERPAGSER